MKREDVKACIEEIGIIPGIRVRVSDLALFAAETLYEAGIPVAEITMTVPGAIEIIGELAQRYPEMVVGAGTVLDKETAERCIKAGAKFITSPGLVMEVVECALKNDVVTFPGAMTPTEVIAAWKSGADYVKIFPAAPLGFDQYVRSISVPLPQIKLIASGGVGQQTALHFIVAGAVALGIGGELLPNEALYYRQANRIHELARRFMTMVKEGRVLRNTYY